MDVEGASAEEIEPASDAGDAIVGTLRPPAWLGRIPALAWLFIALATFDAIYRIAREAPWGPEGTSAVSLASLVFTVVSAAAIVSLPAAILLGRPRLGRAGSWLLQGALALVAAELFRLVGRDIVSSISGPPSIDSETGLSDFLVRSFAVQVPVLLLQAFGVARIGLGLGVIAGAGHRLSRVLLAVLVAAVVVTLIGDVLRIQTFQAASSTDVLQLPYNLVVVVGGTVILALWAWIVSVAARRDGRTWRWIMLGAMAIVLGFVASTIGSIVAFERAFTDDVLTIVIWSGLAASAFVAVGAALLIVVFARGFEPDEAGQGSGVVPGDAPDVRPLSHPVGA